MSVTIDVSLDKIKSGKFLFQFTSEMVKGKIGIKSLDFLDTESKSIPDDKDVNHFEKRLKGSDSIITYRHKFSDMITAFHMRIYLKGKMDKTISMLLATNNFQFCIYG